MLKESRIRVGVVAALMVLANGCTCTDSELYTMASPKGTRTLVVCTRNCGATSGFTTVIQERRGWLSSHVDLIEIGGEARGEKELKIDWAGEDEIVLSVDPKLAVWPIRPFPSDLRVGYAPGTRLGS